MSKIVGFGASETTIANAKAVWPKCLSTDYESCEADVATSTYPGCAQIDALSREDPDLYHQWIQQTPYCTPMSWTDRLMWAGGGLLLGLVLAQVLR